MLPVYYEQGSGDLPRSQLLAPLICRLGTDRRTTSHRRWAGAPPRGRDSSPLIPAFRRIVTPPSRRGIRNPGREMPGISYDSVPAVQGVDIRQILRTAGGAFVLDERLAAKQRHRV